MRTGTISVAVAASVLALVAFEGPTLAADVTRPLVARPLVIDQWSGLYLGVNVGAGRAHKSWDLEGRGNLGRGDANGHLLGVQGGYNWQQGQILLGLEASLDWADIHGTAANPSSPVSGNCYAGGD